MVQDIPSTVLEPNNIILLVFLIVLFVVGYKLMRAVMDLFLVSIFSGLFFVALDYVGIGPAFTVTRFMFFMAAGVGIYMLYSTIATAKGIMELLWKIINVTIDLLQDIVSTVREIAGSLIGGAGSIGDRLRDRGSSGTGSSSSGSGGSGGSKEKMAILQEVDDDD